MPRAVRGQPNPLFHHFATPTHPGFTLGPNPQDLRARLGAEYREAVARRVFTVTGARPDDAAVDAMIESGESETVFQKALLEQGRGHVVDTLAEVQERHEAVRQLEASLLDLHQAQMGRGGKRGIGGERASGAGCGPGAAPTRRRCPLPAAPQVFLDMAVLVEAQGEMLDSIEAQVAKAFEQVS